MNKKRSAAAKDKRTYRCSCCPTVPTVQPISSIEYLINTILPLTGLNSSQINQLISMLSSEKAVIYGSSILYAYKKTLVMGNNNSSVGDIDIAVKDLNQLNTIKNFLTLALSNATIYMNESNSQQRLNVLYTPDNTINYVLKQTSSPPNSGSMGEFILGNNNDIDGNWFFNSYLGFPNITSFYQANKLLIQITYYDNLNPTTNISDYIRNNGDFTVASGIYDGTIMSGSTDIDKNITIYRENIMNFDPSFFKKDWMLYRIQKYIQRGFIIYFDNQTQIDTWNNLLWLTDDTTTQSFVCPFNLKP
jgi:hypothetical protein